MPCHRAPTPTAVPNALRRYTRCKSTGPGHRDFEVTLGLVLTAVLITLVMAILTYTYRTQGFTRPAPTTAPTVHVVTPPPGPCGHTGLPPCH